MKQYLFSILLLVASSSYATITNLDIYGADEQVEKQILACCSGQFAQYDKAYKQFMHSKDQKHDLKAAMDLQQVLIKRINQLAPFSYAQISTVYYPTDDSNFITVDLVQEKDAYRLPRPPERQINTIQQSPELKQLFSLWKEYSENHFYAVKQKKSITTCPVMHCIWGFDKKEQKKYLPTFIQGALKYKKQLMEIVAHSSNDQDRDAAIYLLGHLNNAQELAQFLIEFTDDASEVVRNNSMRVLGYIATKHSLPNLDLHRIIAALDYPCVTDRNKAAFVLSQMVKDKANHAQVIHEAGPVLLKLLHLKQPNNHDFAYNVLKTLSNRNYAETDYAHWQQWLDSVN